MPNTVLATAIDAKAVAAATPNLVIGQALSALQNIVQLDADKNAPHFSESNPPTQDNTAYLSNEGVRYFRPDFQVAERQAPPAGPDVQFLESADGKVRLQFDLEEHRPGGLPAEAVPFNVRDILVALAWLDRGVAKQHVFPRPTLIAFDAGNDPNTPDFLLRVGDELDSAEVEAIYAAMTAANAQAKLLVRMKYGYYVDAGQTGKTGGGTTSGTVDLGGIKIKVNFSTPKTATATAPPISNATINRAILTTNPLVATVGTAATMKAKAPSGGTNVSFALNSDAIKAILSTAFQRAKSAAFKEITISRVIPFHFKPSLAQNRHIYEALTGDDSMLKAWTKTNYGYVRKSSYANTVYRIPDEVRLTYNAELGAPHFIPTVYQDDDEEYRVRVQMRIVPWHDPQRIVALRDELEKLSNGTLLNPAVISGGYDEAVLELTSAFPEGITALGGESLQFSLDYGADLTLDLSLEFYKYLAGLLVSPVGLTGKVTVWLDEKGSAESGDTKRKKQVIPVRISMDDLAALPIQLEVNTEEARPEEVRVRSLAHCDIRARCCEIRLLQWDANSVAPLAVFDAEPVSHAIRTGTFPIRTQQPIDIAVQPAQGVGDAFWNAIQLELAGMELVDSSAACLEKIYELAPPGSLSWAVEAECPVFLQTELPATFKNLYKVEVLISRAGFAPQQLMLSKAAPTGTVPLERTLADILSVNAMKLCTFSYQVRNVYYDHSGGWGPLTTSTGPTLIVFPNSTDGD